MRETPFHELERARGAVFGDSFGWTVPLRYERGSAPIAAARGSAAIVAARGSAPGAAARGAAGIVDLSPSGRLKVTGKDRKDLLQRISTNDLSSLAPGSFAPTLFVTPKGRIVDRALVLDQGDRLLLLTSPAGRERLPAWIDRFIFSEEVQITDVSSETSAFVVSGPSADSLVREVSGVRAGAIGAGRFLGVPVSGIDTLIAPYDGLPSAWVFLAEVPGILAAFEKVLATGEPAGLELLGIEEAEVLRIESGLPADGHELTEEFNPWEARLEGSFSLSKGCYTGQEVIARLNTYDKVQRRLVGLRFAVAGPVGVPQRVYEMSEVGGDKEIGVLTSAAFSDRFGEAIGLAIIRCAFEEPGTELTVGEARLEARVCALPFA